jgi:hypothetical protein
MPATMKSSRFEPVTVHTNYQKVIPISKQDRAALDTLRQLIDDPQISLETRSELREESLGIATGYIVAEALQDTDAAEPT